MNLAFPTYRLVRMTGPRSVLFLAPDGTGEIAIRTSVGTVPTESVVQKRGVDEVEIFSGSGEDAKAVFDAILASFARTAPDRRSTARTAVLSGVAGALLAYAAFAGATGWNGQARQTEVASADTTPDDAPEPTPSTGAPALIDGSLAVEAGPAPTIPLPSLEAIMAGEASLAANPAPDAPEAASDTGDAVAGTGSPALELPGTEDGMADARRNVADRGVDGGMADVALLQQALASVQSGRKIDPSILERLPHSIAAELRQAGAVLDVAEAAEIAGVGSANVVTLQPGTLDRFRDADGIATVPGTNSWILTDGIVRIPPPGGGDIRSAEDFARFGFEG